MNVALVRKGSVYGPEYVSKLSRQIKRHCDAEIVTLTDCDDTPGRTERLECDLPGWWSKIELFRPSFKSFRPFLYLDLDSFVFLSVEQLRCDTFTMVKDFNDWFPSNSCAMWVDKTPTIFEEFMTDPQKHMKECGGKGDQDFIGRYCSAHFSPGLVTSYKKDGRDGPCGVVMQFHGRPKMPDVKTGWVAGFWRE